MLVYQRVVEQKFVGETIWVQHVVSKPGLKVHMLETTIDHQTPIEFLHPPAVLELLH